MSNPLNNESQPKPYKNLNYADRPNYIENHAHCIWPGSTQTFLDMLPIHLNKEIVCLPFRGRSTGAQGGGVVPLPSHPRNVVG